MRLKAASEKWMYAFVRTPGSSLTLSISRRQSAEIVFSSPPLAAETRSIDLHYVPNQGSEASKALTSFSPTEVSSY